MSYFKKNNVEILLSLTVLGLTELSCTVLAQGSFVATVRQWLDSLPHHISFSWAGKTEQPGAGAAGLLSFREVLMGVSELSL